MNEQSRGANSSGTHSSGAMAALVLALCLLLPALYVLSIGPAVWLVERTGGTGEEVLEFIYAPLVWLHEGNEFARDGLDWYMEFWE